MQRPPSPLVRSRPFYVLKAYDPAEDPQFEQKHPRGSDGKFAKKPGAKTKVSGVTGAPKEPEKEAEQPVIEGMPDPKKYEGVVLSMEASKSLRSVFGEAGTFTNHFISDATRDGFVKRVERFTELLFPHTLRDKDYDRWKQTVDDTANFENHPWDALFEEGLLDEVPDDTKNTFYGHGKYSDIDLDAPLSAEDFESFLEPVREQFKEVQANTETIGDLLDLPEDAERLRLVSYAAGGTAASAPGTPAPTPVDISEAGLKLQIDRITPSSPKEMTIRLKGDSLSDKRFNLELPEETTIQRLLEGEMSDEERKETLDSLNNQIGYALKTENVNQLHHASRATLRLKAAISEYQASYADAHKKMASLMTATGGWPANIESDVASTMSMEDITDVADAIVDLHEHIERLGEFLADFERPGLENEVKLANAFTTNIPGNAIAAAAASMADRAKMVKSAASAVAHTLGAGHLDSEFAWEHKPKAEENWRVERDNIAEAKTFLENNPDVTMEELVTDFLLNDVMDPSSTPEAMEKSYQQLYSINSQAVRFRIVRPLEQLRASAPSDLVHAHDNPENELRFNGEAIFPDAKTSWERDDHKTQTDYKIRTQWALTKGLTSAMKKNKELASWLKKDIETRLERASYEGVAEAYQAGNHIDKTTMEGALASAYLELGESAFPDHTDEEKLKLAAIFKDLRISLDTLSHASAPKHLTEDDLVLANYVKEYVATWAASSTNTNPKSLAVQEAAHRVLAGGSEEEWERVLDEIGDLSNSASLRLKIENTQKNDGPFIDAFVKTMYDATQQRLTDAGYEEDEELVLYRGMRFSERSQNPEWADVPVSYSDWLESRKVDDENEVYAGVDVSLNPLSSWSISKTEAEGFSSHISSDYDGAGIILVANIPRKNIVGIPGTGIGCLGEDEIVVLGGDNRMVEDAAMFWRFIR